MARVNWSIASSGWPLPPVRLRQRLEGLPAPAVELDGRLEVRHGLVPVAAVDPEQAAVDQQGVLQLRVGSGVQELEGLPVIKPRPPRAGAGSRCGACLPGPAGSRPRCGPGWRSGTRRIPRSSWSQARFDSSWMQAVSSRPGLDRPAEPQAADGGEVVGPEVAGLSSAGRRRSGGAPRPTGQPCTVPCRPGNGPAPCTSGTPFAASRSCCGRLLVALPGQAIGPPQVVGAGGRPQPRRLVQEPQAQVGLIARRRPGSGAARSSPP